jgi:hypothetical protein
MNGAITARFADDKVLLVAAFSVLFPWHLLNCDADTGEGKLLVLIQFYEDDFPSSSQMIRRVAIAEEAAFSECKSLGDVAAWIISRGHHNVFPNIFAIELEV